MVKSLPENKHFCIQCCRRGGGKRGGRLLKSEEGLIPLFTLINHRLQMEKHVLSLHIWMLYIPFTKGEAQPSALANTTQSLHWLHLFIQPSNQNNHHYTNLSKHSCKLTKILLAQKRTDHGKETSQNHIRLYVPVYVKHQCYPLELSENQHQKSGFHPLRKKYFKNFHHWSRGIFPILQVGINGSYLVTSTQAYTCSFKIA